MSNASVSVVITGGATIPVPWAEGMTVRQALEGAHDTAPRDLTFEVQYFGHRLGYLVAMINETYDTFRVEPMPNYFWHLLVNGTDPGTGIDETILSSDDTVSFTLERYDSARHAGTLLEEKFNFLARLPGT
jgi:Domain of unknown function (DUF4430)